MTKKETGLNIHQRIHAIMEDVSYVKKGGVNTFQKYAFTKHDDVTALLRPSLISHRVVVIPSVKRHSKGDKQEKNGVAILTETDISVEFINIDNPDDKITVDFFGYGIDKNDLGPGKATSYAMKTAMLKVFSLETGERDNEETADDKNISPRKTEPEEPELTEEQKRFKSIGLQLTNAKSADKAAEIWNDNLHHITAFSEAWQSRLKVVKDKYDDPFPGDM